MIIPNFDHSARSGKSGLIYVNSTPELFKKSINHTIKIIDNKRYEYKIVFLRSWNEWGEGNYVEPDLKFGYKYLDALRESIFTT